MGFTILRLSKYKMRQIQSKPTFQCLILCIAALGFLLAYSPAGRGDDITVLAVQYAWIGNVYEIDTQVNLELSPQVLEALNKGVPVILALDIAVERERGYWWNERVANLEQRYQLRYHALTSQYMVTNLNTGAQRNLPSLDAALIALGQIDDVPVLDRQLLDPDEAYFAKLRVRVDVSALPAPLRLWSYVRSGWRLSSEWYTWKLVM